MTNIAGVSIPVDFTSRDYQSIRQDLINAIPSFLPEWTSTDPNDMGIALIECLVGDTLVHTPQGIMMLKDIEIGQEVFNAAGVGRVTHRRTVTKSRLVEVRAGVDRFACSEDHLFFTARGWVRANELKLEDRLITQKASLRILSDDLHTQGGVDRSFLPMGVLSGMGPREAHSRLRSVRKELHRSGHQQDPRPEILLSSMLRSVQERASSITTGLLSLWQRVRAESGWAERFNSPSVFPKMPICFCPSEENLGASYRRGRARWPSQGSVLSLEGVRRSGSRLVRSVLGLTPWKLTRRSVLFNRRSKSSYENSCRGGRAGSYCGQSYEGSDPTAMAGGIRVDRVEVHEPGSPFFTKHSGGEDYVTLYDLTVSRHPSFAVGAQGVLVHNCFAYVGDVLNFYLDRIANEAFLATAQQRSSVLNLAYLIDYAPQDSVAASTILTITVRANSPSFFLPKGSQFATASSTNQPAIIFETNSDHTIPASGSTTQTLASTLENSIQVPMTVVQGVTVYNEAVGTSSGAADQTFTLFNTPVIEGSQLVSIDEGAGFKPWNLVNHLIDAGPYDAAYMVAVDANGIVYVTFGDGNNGRIPNPQGIIQATYRVGGGSIGNVGAQQITVDLTNTSYFASVTNPDPATGGSDPETIPQIQANAPKSLTAAGRCVSVQDYASVALDAPGVSKANAVATVSTAVTLYIHPAGGPYKQADLTGLVSDSSVGLAQALTNSAGTGYLDDKMMAGTTVTVLAPQYGGAIGYMPVVIGMTVTVLAQYSALQVEQDVLSALDALLDFGSADFGQIISISAVYHAVQEVAGVDFLIVSEMRRDDGTPDTVQNIVCGPNEIPVSGDPDTGVTQITVATSGGL